MRREADSPADARTTRIVGVEALIRFTRPGIGHLSLLVAVLAGLLSAFFWLGYWTSELTSRVADRPQVQSAERPANPDQPKKPAPTPAQQLEIRSEDVVRL